jgi:hypothetical protein
MNQDFSLDGYRAGALSRHSVFGRRHPVYGRPSQSFVDDHHRDGYPIRRAGNGACGMAYRQGIQSICNCLPTCQVDIDWHTIRNSKEISGYEPARGGAKQEQLCTLDSEERLHREEKRCRECPRQRTADSGACARSLPSVWAREVIT